MNERDTNRTATELLAAKQSRPHCSKAAPAVVEPHRNSHGERATGNESGANLGRARAAARQFAIGMAVNLYAVIPSRHAGAHPANYLSGSIHSVGWAISSGPAVLAAHAALGFFLVLVALHVLALAIRTGRRTTTIAAVLAWDSSSARASTGRASLISTTTPVP